MKKTILLTALLASASAFAGTHGSVGTSVEFKTDYTKKGALTNEFKGTKVTPKVEAEVAVDGTGFSFGGEYYLKELQPLNSGSLTLGTIESASKGHIFMKYELPEIKGVKSYVKGTFNDKKELTGEFDAKYEHNGYVFGFNSETKIPLFQRYYDVTKVEDLATLSIERDKEVAVLKAVKEDKVKAADSTAVTKDEIDKLTAEKKKKDSSAQDATKDDVIAKRKADIDEEYNKAMAKITKKYDGYTTLTSPQAETVSKHTLSVEKDKLGKFSDLKASVAVEHAWGNTYHLDAVKGKDRNTILTLDDLAKKSEAEGTTIEKVSNKDAFKSVELKGEGQYKGFDKLNLKGQVAIKYNHNGSDLAGEFLGYDAMHKQVGKAIDHIRVNRNVTDKFALTGVYTGIDKLKLTAKLFVNHLGEVKYINNMKQHFVEYGVDANLEYKAMENLTLTGNAVFAGQAMITKYEKEKTDSKGKKYSRKAENCGYVKLAAGAKYDYKVNDKLTVTPEVNGMFESANIHNEKDGDKSKFVALNTVAITPKVAVDYKISDTLSLNGALESKFVFDNLNLEGKIKYDHTTVKSSLGLKYTW